jgi:hypothetical protein
MPKPNDIGKANKSARHYNLANEDANLNENNRLFCARMDLQGQQQAGPGGENGPAVPVLRYQTLLGPFRPTHPLFTASGDIGL